ncbi:MAG: hypothetical protein M1819_004801 [Sarea resinae]|nr:MAG: hypothetical protein M1819_004801 [Sarea resinae]
MELSYFEVEAPDGYDGLTVLQITNRLTADTQAIQLGTSEKVGLFIQSISYFVTAFTVGFILNAKLTGILFAAVIPSMLIIVCLGTTFVSKLSKRASECTALATSVAEGAINAVQVVQAFNALGVLSDDHFRHLTRAVRSGVQKAIVGAFMLGGVYFVA